MKSSRDYSIELKRLLRTAFSSAKTAALAVAAALLLWGVPAQTFGDAAETCPGTTTPAAEFTWTTSAWTADGQSAGISVWGDSMLARWSTTGAPIAAVVITAGTVTINYTYDPVALQGAVAATDVEAAAGAPLAHLGFCTGPSTNPTSGSGISVGVTKTESCAVVNADQTATVQGTITVVRHKPEQDPILPRVAIRIRTTRDTIFAGDGSILGEETSIAGLTGFVMASETDTVSVPYHVTFSPGTADAFSNKIEITIENATSGLDRHKYYSALAAFGLCQVGAATATPTPTPEHSQAPAQSHSPEGSVKAVVGSPPTSIPNTAFASPPSLPTSVVFFALLMLSSLGTLGLATVRVARRRPRK